MGPPQIPWGPLGLSGTVAEEELKTLWDPLRGPRGSQRAPCLISPLENTKKHFFSNYPTKCFKNQHFWKWDTKTLTVFDLDLDLFFNLGSPERQCGLQISIVNKIMKNLSNFKPS